MTRARTHYPRPSETTQSFQASERVAENQSVDPAMFGKSLYKRLAPVGVTIFIGLGGPVYSPAESC